MLIRTKFAKKAAVRYISHLELMDALRRAFRRAELPAAYSEGFNPHIKLAMGQPLSVGMTGEGEYFDLELEEEINPEEYQEKLNKNLPQGIRIIEAKEVPAGVKSLSAVVNTAEYLLKMNFDGQIDEQLVLKDFLDREEINVLRKRRKKDDIVIDIRPFIYRAEVIGPGLWKFIVATGSSGNLRPSEVSRALAEHHHQINDIPVINIVRQGMYVRLQGELYQPFAENVVGS